MTQWVYNTDCAQSTGASSQRERSRIVLERGRSRLRAQQRLQAPADSTEVLLVVGKGVFYADRGEEVPGPCGREKPPQTSRDECGDGSRIPEAASAK